MEIRDSAVEDAEGLAALVDAVAGERLFLAGTAGFSVEDTRAFISSTKKAGGVQVVAIEFCPRGEFRIRQIRLIGLIKRTNE